MKRSYLKCLLWIAAILAGMIVVIFTLVSQTVPHGAPDEAQARRDFLAKHPGFAIDRVIMDEREVVALSYRILYRVPGDSTPREAFRQYVHSKGAWRITSE